VSKGKSHLSWKNKGAGVKEGTSMILCILNSALKIYGNKIKAEGSMAEISAED